MPFKVPLYKEKQRSEKQSKRDYKLQAILNKCVLKVDLKMSRDGALWMLGRREFQMEGAAELKAQSPKDWSQDLELKRRTESTEY